MNKVLPQLVCHQCLPPDWLTTFFNTGRDIKEKAGASEWRLWSLRSQDQVGLKGTITLQSSEDRRAEDTFPGFNSGSVSLVYLVYLDRWICN